MVYVLLLLSEKLSTHGIEGVRMQLVVALYRLEYVEYHTAFDSDFIGLAHACLCAGKGSLLHAAALSLNATKVRKNVDLKRARTVDEIRNIKANNVVTGYNIRVAGDDEVAPRMKHFAFAFERVYFSPADRRAGLEGENIFYTWRVAALHCDPVCDLDYRVFLRHRKRALFALALDIEAENPQRGDLCVGVWVCGCVWVWVCMERIYVEYIYIERERERENTCRIYMYIECVCVRVYVRVYTPQPGDLGPLALGFVGNEILPHNISFILARGGEGAAR